MMALSKWPEVETKLNLIESWCRDGLVEADICHNLGISVQTLQTYKREHLSLFTALKKGKEVVDLEVVNALHRRAMGYTMKLVKQKLTKDGDVVEIEEEVHIPPDVTAQIFWLKNRRPKEWRDKRETETIIEVKVPMIEEIKDTFKQMRIVNSVDVIDIQ